MAMYFMSCRNTWIWVMAHTFIPKVFLESHGNDRFHDTKKSKKRAPFIRASRVQNVEK